MANTNQIVKIDDASSMRSPQRIFAKHSSLRSSLFGFYLLT